MNLTERVKNILLQPAEEWAVIEKEPTTTGDLFTSYIMPLAAIGPVASIVGLSLVGIQIPMGGTYRVSLATSSGHAVVTYVMALAGVYVLGLVIDALVPTFNGTKNSMQALKVAAYSSTAAWLVGIFNLIPALAFLQIFGLYSLYLLYLGLPALMKSPEDKTLAYTVVVIIAGLMIFAIIGAVGGSMITYPIPR
ncbi:MAG: Yip1 family protein [Candidatus Binatia bacterium]